MTPTRRADLAGKLAIAVLVTTGGAIAGLVLIVIGCGIARLLEALWLW